MLFDYDNVKRALTDHSTFSSRNGPVDWMIFLDPPRHNKLRSLISQAFTPRSVSNMEPVIKRLSKELLDKQVGCSQMDLAADYAVPLPMMVIASMLGVPAADQPKFIKWNDAILKMSYTVPGGAGVAAVVEDFKTATFEMSVYLAEQLAQRTTAPREDLLTRLLQSELDGQRLAAQEILGFFQLLLLAGSETTTNLINNAILCFIEHPAELERLKSHPELLPSAIEEVLRYRAPLQWMFRIPTRDLEIAGQTIPKGKVVLCMIGSANHDQKYFNDPDRFVISRNPNPHLAFGHGAHFCLGAPLARLEAKIALTDLLSRLEKFELAEAEPWEPRAGLHVHGPTRLPIKFRS
jgi:cytochrome P450